MPFDEVRAYLPIAVLAALTNAVLVGTLLTGTVSAQDEIAPADMDLDQLIEVQVEVATGFAQPLSRAPAVASVITAAEIEEMGATHLDEVLETVPGLHVGLARGRGLDPVYAVRGIRSGTNGQILVLVDGLPINQLQNGGPVLGFHIPVTSIARVEVIRGPGSAIYGADAFAGVINIITKTATEIRGTEVGIRGGSFDAREVWLAHGARLSGWDVAFTVDWRESGGDPDRVVESDLQTDLDAVFGTDATFSPGRLNTSFETIDVHLGLARGPWTARFWGWGTERGLGAGAAPILDPKGSQDTSQFLGDVTYHRDDLAANWEFTQRFSYLYIDQYQQFNIFPPGAVLPIAADGNVSFTPGEARGLVFFPDGVIGNPGDAEDHVSLDSAAAYMGFQKHRWRLNVGLRLQELDSRETKNFGPGVIDGTEGVVDGTLTDVSDTEFVFMKDNERDNWHVSLQDEWSIAPAWQLTVGLRYDRYSDFGGTLNPRAALVWSGRRDISAKLLYGSAFRAPVFGQLFAINNPVGLGNPDLQPEEIDTLELAFDYRPATGLRAAVSFFGYRAEGLIDQIPDAPGSSSTTAQNANDQDGHGLEVELEWESHEAFCFVANFAWQSSEDAVTGAGIAEAPGRQLYLGATWRPWPGWSLHGQLHWIADRLRAPDDPRPPLDDYTTANLVLRRKRIFEHWDFALSARNLFDEIGREPSDPAIPGDFPLAGRDVYGEIRYRIP